MYALIRCAIFAGLLLLLGIPCLPTSAHAGLESSVPAAGGAIADDPEHIELRFSERVDPGLSSIALIGSDGSAVALGPSAVATGDSHVLRAAILDPTTIASGVYTVVWGAYSAEDGHASSGSFTFSVGTGEAPAQAGTDASVPVWSIIGKWLELVGIVLLAGLAFFWVTSGRPSFDLRTVLILSAIVLVGAAISLRAREVAISGSRMLGPIDGDTILDLLRTTYGRAWLVRVLLLLLALGIATVSKRVAERTAASVLLACGAISLGAIAISGHAAAVDPVKLAMAVDFVHMAAAAAWLGGLLGLLLCLTSGADSADDRRLLRTQGNRFVVAIVLIVTAGVGSAYWHIGGRRSLTASDYGRTLLVKIAVVAAIFGIAWYNRRVLQAEPGRPRWIPLAIGAELVLATVVLLFSADLSQTPPANQPLTVQVAARALAVSESASAGATQVQLSGVLTGDPTDEIFISVAPVTDLQRVIVRTSLIDGADGDPIGDRFDASPVEGQPGSYVIPAGRLGIAGPWQLEITVRRAGVGDELVTIPLDTSQLIPHGTRSIEDSWGGFRMTSHTALALLLAVVMLVVGLGGLRRITGLEPLASGFLLAASLLIAGGFLVSAARGVLPVTPDHALAPPTAASPGAVTYAGDLYPMNCAICHGADGRGSGSTNLAHLHGNAADLTGGQTESQSDGDLFYWIRNGVPGTRMPAFDQALSDDEVWQLVEEIRRLQDEARAVEERE